MCWPGASPQPRAAQSQATASQSSRLRCSGAQCPPRLVSLTSGDLGPFLCQGRGCRRWALTGSAEGWSQPLASGVYFRRPCMIPAPREGASRTCGRAPGTASGDGRGRQPRSRKDKTSEASLRDQGTFRKRQRALAGVSAPSCCLANAPAARRPARPPPAPGGWVRPSGPGSLVRLQ